MTESRSSPRRISATDKQRKALELRKAGVDYRTIANTVGYSGPSGAHKAVASALHKTLKEPADDVRALELERLDRILQGIWAAATKGNLDNIDRVLKVMSRRAALLGLDEVKPEAQTVVNVQVSAEWVQIRTTIMQALADFPDARLRVSEALAALEG